MTNKLFKKLSEFDQVEAIALGGSRSGEIKNGKKCVQRGFV